MISFYKYVDRKPILICELKCQEIQEKVHNIKQTKFSILDKIDSQYYIIFYETETENQLLNEALDELNNKFNIYNETQFISINTEHLKNISTNFTKFTKVIKISISSVKMLFLKISKKYLPESIRHLDLGKFRNASILYDLQDFTKLQSISLNFEDYIKVKFGELIEDRDICCLFYTKKLREIVLVYNDDFSNYNMEESDFISQLYKSEYFLCSYKDKIKSIKINNINRTITIKLINNKFESQYLIEKAMRKMVYHIPTHYITELINQNPIHISILKNLINENNKNESNKL